MFSLHNPFVNSKRYSFTRSINSFRMVLGTGQRGTTSMSSLYHHHKYSSACSSLLLCQDCAGVSTTNKPLTGLGWGSQWLFCSRRPELCQALSVPSTVKGKSSHSQAWAKHKYTTIFWQNLPVLLFFPRPGLWLCDTPVGGPISEQSGVLLGSLQAQTCGSVAFPAPSATRSFHQLQGCSNWHCSDSSHFSQLGARAAYFKARLVMIPSYSQGMREAFPAAPSAWLCCLPSGLVAMHQGANSQWSTAGWWFQFRHPP